MTNLVFEQCTRMSPLHTGIQTFKFHLKTDLFKAVFVDNLYSYIFFSLVVNIST